MLDELRRIAMFTSGVAELSRDRAEKLVRKAVARGDVRTGQASSVVKNLVEVSRQNRKELLNLVRSELQSQIANLGVATARDVQRLERRVARLEERTKATSPSSRPGASSGTRAKTTSAATSSKATSAKRSATARSAGSGGAAGGRGATTKAGPPGSTGS